MNITLNQAISILQDASAITVNIDGYPATLQPRLIEDVEKDEDIFMQIEQELDGKDYTFDFPIGPNKKIKLDGSSLFLKESEGKKIEIILMKVWDVGEEIKHGAYFLQDEETD